MFYLILVTALWAFSFSLIGEYLLDLDKYFLAFVRVLLAALLFLPFTKFKQIPHTLQIQLLIIGAIQIGLMSLLLYHSYNFLNVPEILLFTIFTPIYVTFVYDVLAKRFNYLYLISAAIAVLGAFIIRYKNINEDFWIGFLLIQAANLCFAIGQSTYKYILEKNKNVAQKEIFGYFHFGALIIITILYLTCGNFTKSNPSLPQWLILLWLGLVASGIGYFLWNKGATMVDAGTLGIMNNALIPAGLIINITIWNRIENYTTLSIGTIVIIGSLLFHAKIAKPKSQPQSQSQSQS
ncbi:MAG: EamA family transporter [Planctomycetaceae bacterium]|jgi:carboxylate/amino acid/amine transporter|nr:EamA family transporter [Planctomycetaceae bacterium]